MPVPAGIFAMNKSIANVCKLLDMAVATCEHISLNSPSFGKTLGSKCKSLMSGENQVPSPEALLSKLVTIHNSNRILGMT